MRYLLFITILIITFPVVIRAQAGGSAYSTFGVGDPNILGWGQRRALAGASVALHSDFLLNVGNPASYTALKGPATVLFDFGINLEVNTYSTDNENIWQRDGNLSHLSFLIRPAKSYASVIGMEPYTTVKYSLFGDRADFRTINTGSGGLSKVYWGHSLKLFPRTRIGVNLGYILGSVTRTEKVIDFFTGNFDVEIKTAYRGSTFDFGLQQEIALGDDLFTVGFTASTGSKLRGVSEGTLDALGSRIEEELDFDNDESSLPFDYGFGFAYRRKQMMLTAEAKYSTWSDLGNEPGVTWQNVLSLTTGLEYGIKTKNTYSKQQELLLRAGINVRSSRMLIDGEQPNEYVSSLGIGIPYRRGKNHLNVSYNYHQRGTKNSNLILEQCHGVSIGISIRDKWFEQRRIN